jgi:transcriptional regulator
LLIAGGPEAYVSPSWYAAKAEHGKVVPTWNYAAVHLIGTLRIHQDGEWLRRAVTELTDVHESGRRNRWHVDDAPERYINAQLNGIVGIEFTVIRVEGKAKFSQNRSEADQLGVIAGLRIDDDASGAPVGTTEVADAMESRRRAVENRPDASLAASDPDDRH